MATRARYDGQGLTLRAADSPIDLVLAAADDVRALGKVARTAITYANEIYHPNIREPYSIVNRRTDLVEQVRAYQRQRRSLSANLRGAIRRSA